jgi:hypothetical protein
MPTESHPRPRQQDQRVDPGGVKSRRTGRGGSMVAEKRFTRRRMLSTAGAAAAGTLVATAGPARADGGQEIVGSWSATVTATDPPRVVRLATELPRRWDAHRVPPSVPGRFPVRPGARERRTWRLEAHRPRSIRRLVSVPTSASPSIGRRARGSGCRHPRARDQWNERSRRDLLVHDQGHPRGTTCSRREGPS